MFYNTCSARADADRKRRQVEQCLSLAEERAERAEAEAHNVLVESQLASTLGVKLYEVEREKDILHTQVQTLRLTMDQMRIQIAEATQKYESLIRKLEHGRVEREHLEATNLSLVSDLRQLRSGVVLQQPAAAVNTTTTTTLVTSRDGSLAGGGGEEMEQLQQKLRESEVRNEMLRKRAAEVETKSQSVQKVLQRLVL